MKYILLCVLGVIIGVGLTLLAFTAGWLEPIAPAKPKPGEWGSFAASPKVELLDDGRELRLLEDFAYLDPQGKVWAAKKNSVPNRISLARRINVSNGLLVLRIHTALFVTKVEI